MHAAVCIPTVTGAPTLETRMDDVRAVMDAAGSERAALMGTSEGGPMNLLFAATYPERTSALVLIDALAATGDLGDDRVVLDSDAMMNLVAFL